MLYLEHECKPNTFRIYDYYQTYFLYINTIDNNKTDEIYTGSFREGIVAMIIL